MKDNIKSIHIGTEEKPSIKLIEPNYEGITKTLKAFTEVYKVCEDKKIIDKALEIIFKPSYFVTSPNINIPPDIINSLKDD